MASVVDRMIRAAKLDGELFREVQEDETALRQSMGSVLISSAAAGQGGVGLGGPLGLVFGAITALLGWFVWTFVVHIVGTRLLPEPRTRADLVPLMRATGFAAAPGVVRIFGIIPLLAPLANLVATLWMLAAFVVAVRQVLSYTSTGRAVAVCAVGWFLYWAVIGLFTMFGLGGLLLI